MTKGSTPTLKFTFPFETKYIKEVTITIIDYKSPTMYTIEKHLSDCDIYDKAVSVRLQSEETLKLEENNKIKIQIIVETTDGGKYPSEVFYREVKELLEKEVI